MGYVLWMEIGEWGERRIGYVLWMENGENEGWVVFYG